VTKVFGRLVKLPVKRGEDVRQTVTLLVIDNQLVAQQARMRKNSLLTLNSPA
jgi:hypothetical protein